MTNSSPGFQVELINAGKKFFRNWIFRNLQLDITAGGKLAILGTNGSGKSTLLQVIAGYESLSEGNIRYSKDGLKIERENIFMNLSLAAPYLELIEEFTLEEITGFQFRFKKAVSNFSTNEIIELAELEGSKNKVFKYFSSGMKQRAKLALAILSDVDLILLDEPLSNLDHKGEAWYRKMAGDYLQNKTVVVCSNQYESEYFFCDRNINLTEIPR